MIPDGFSIFGPLSLSLFIRSRMEFDRSAINDGGRHNDDDDDDDDDGATASEKKTVHWGWTWVCGCFFFFWIGPYGLALDGLVLTGGPSRPCP